MLNYLVHSHKQLYTRDRTSTRSCFGFPKILYKNCDQDLVQDLVLVKSPVPIVYFVGNGFFILLFYKLREYL